jgi:anti-anti-sigma regulatory factor
LSTTPPRSDAWTLAEGDGGRLVVTLRGELDEPTAQRLAQALRDKTAAATPGAYDVVFDLNGLRRCSVEARGVLADLQRYLGGCTRRTAYVTNRPIFRGLALWVCHTAPDSNARTFPSLGHAKTWMNSQERREDVLVSNASHWIGRLRGRSFATEASQ